MSPASRMRMARLAGSPALARVPGVLFGICLVDTNGVIHAPGDADHPFTIRSVSKRFVFARVCEQCGPDERREKIGVNATGLAFNSLAAIERDGSGRTNPMVNAGAIATTSLVPGGNLEEKWQFIQAGLTRFAGRSLPLNAEVYEPASETNYRNQSIARLLQSFGRVYMDPAEAVELYTRQCALDVTARDLAVMGATLADGGVNPITRERVVAPAVCHYALVVMTTAARKPLGDRLYETGLRQERHRRWYRLVSPARELGFSAVARCGRQRHGTLARLFSQRLGMTCLFLAGRKTSKHE